MDAVKQEGNRGGMEWTREQTLELLREYEQRRVLWDENVKDYRDRVKRKRVIEELAETLGCSSFELVRKINNLKCHYSREVHKTDNSKEAGNGPDDRYVSNWYAFKAMQFLKYGTLRYSPREKQEKTNESKLEEEEKEEEEEEYILSDIDPKSITFIESNDEELTNGSFNSCRSLGERSGSKKIIDAEKQEGNRVGIKWTKDKTLELLREYVQRRVLWDENDEGYRDRVKRKRVIHELAETLGCNSLEIERKINNLKCQYAREVHKIEKSKEAGNGPNDIYVSYWFAFNAMQFLTSGTRRNSPRENQEKTSESKLEEEEAEEEEEYIVSDINPESMTFIESNDDELTDGSLNACCSRSERRGKKKIMDAEKQKGNRGRMEWTREKTLELLREYLQRRVLWDENAKGYRDRAKRKRVIHELADTLGCNSLELERKINNLKCQYATEVHKIEKSKEAGNGPDDIYVSNWFAFKAMQFIKSGTRRCKARKKQQNTTELKLEEEEEEEEEYIVSDIDPDGITFIESNDEEMTNGSFNGCCSLSERSRRKEIMDAVKQEGNRGGIEWTRDKTLEMLREYQQRRVLWDVNAKGYRDWEKRKRVIHELAKTLGCTSLELKTKICRLKGHYARELHKTENSKKAGNGPDDIYVSKWFAFKAMQFLEYGTRRYSGRKKKQKTTESKLEEEEVEEEEEEEEEYIVSDIDPESITFVESNDDEMTNGSFNVSCSLSERGRRKKITNAEKQVGNWDGIEWTRDKTLELVREYQQRRVLWDENAKGYRDWGKRKRVLHELAETLGCNSLELKTKISRLKGQYWREVHRIQNSKGAGNGTDDVYVSKWFAFKAMQFLKYGTRQYSARKKEQMTIESKLKKEKEEEEYIVSDIDPDDNLISQQKTIEPKEEEEEYIVSDIDPESGTRRYSARKKQQMTIESKIKKEKEEEEYIVSDIDPESGTRRYSARKKQEMSIESKVKKEEEDEEYIVSNIDPDDNLILQQKTIESKPKEEEEEEEEEYIVSDIDPESGIRRCSARKKQQMTIESKVKEEEKEEEYIVSDIDPLSITFIESNDEEVTNGSFNVCCSVSEQEEQQVESSCLKNNI